MDKINQNKSLNIIIAVLVAIFGGLAYFIYTNELREASDYSSNNIYNGANNKENSALSEINWRNITREIAGEARKEFPDIRIEDEFVSIYKESDVTGDNKNEVFVNLGPAGAYTSYVVLVRMQGNKPVFPSFKHKNGKIEPILFLSGASVRNELDVEMIKDKQAVYSSSLFMDNEGKTENCEIGAYKWNSTMGIFEFNKELTHEFENNYCGKGDKIIKI